MITDSNKRQAGLNLLQRLRRQGIPQREEKMESMFDSLVMGDEGEPKQEDEEGTKEGTSESPDYEYESPEEKEKKKGPKLVPSKVEQFKKGFKSVF